MAEHIYKPLPLYYRSKKSKNRRNRGANKRSAAVTVITVILILTGILCIAAVVPAVLSSVINVGVYAGAAIGLFTILLGAFMPRCISSRNMVIRIIYRIFLTAYLLLVIYAGVLSAMMINAMGNAADLSAGDPVIVLGCQVRTDGEPSLMLAHRLDTAYDYMNRVPDTFCIVSGGKGESEQQYEAYAMRDYLMDKGVDGSRIFVEANSHSTYENLRYSKNILSHLECPRCAVIATDGFHQYRATLMALKLGYGRVTCLNSETPLHLLPTYWIREWFALSHCFVFGFDSE